MDILPKLETIAKKHLAIETLSTRKSDSLDFYNVSVWGIKAALITAYNAGRDGLLTTTQHKERTMYYDAKWNGDTITILVDPKRTLNNLDTDQEEPFPPCEQAKLIAAEVFSVDPDAPEIEYNGQPEMTEGQAAHAAKHGWFDPDNSAN